MRRHRERGLTRCAVLGACLLTAMPSVCALAQVKKDTTKQGNAVGDALSSVAAQLLAALQIAAQAHKWAAPPPCGGRGTVSHARGKSSIFVPELKGRDASQAQDTLRMLGFGVDARIIRMDGEDNVVGSQAPPGKTAASPGDTVILCVRRAPVFPPVVRLPFDAALKVLADSGYAGARIDVAVSNSAQIGIVVRQQPINGSAAALGSVDTVFVGIARPAPAVLMPSLIDSTYGGAVIMLEALMQANGLKLHIDHGGVNGQLVDTTGSRVENQIPPAHSMLTPTSLVVLILRNASVPQKPAQILMPSVIDTAYPRANAWLHKLFAVGKLNLAVTLRGPAGQPIKPPTSVVDSQVPSAGTVLDGQSDVRLFVHDTTTTPPPPPPPPPPSPSLMPLLINLTYADAADTLHRRNLHFSARSVRRDTNVGANLIVVSQTPAAGDTITAETEVTIVVRDPTSRWKWIAVVSAILAGAALLFLRWWNHPGPVLAMHVEPKLDAGHPRMVLTARDEETANEAFARIGLTLRAIADPGTPQLHFPRPPRLRNETGNA